MYEYETTNGSVNSIKLVVNNVAVGYYGSMMSVTFSDSGGSI